MDVFALKTKSDYKAVNRCCIIDKGKLGLPNVRGGCCSLERRSGKLSSSKTRTYKECKITLKKEQIDLSTYATDGTPVTCIICVYYALCTNVHSVLDQV